MLDELNLAPFDLLQRIQGLLERAPGAHLALPECGNEKVLPHEEVRIFACMNPPRLPAAEDQEVAAPRATPSAGKKELPPGLRGRFAEIFVDEASGERRCHGPTGLKCEAFGQVRAVIRAVRPYLSHFCACREPFGSLGPRADVVEPPKGAAGALPAEEGEESGAVDARNADFMPLSRLEPMVSGMETYGLRPVGGPHVEVFLVPTWCSQCKGVLVGSGFQCSGPCGMKHLGPIHA